MIFLIVFTRLVDVFFCRPEKLAFYHQMQTYLQSSTTKDLASKQEQQKCQDIGYCSLCQLHTTATQIEAQTIYQVIFCNCKSAHLTVGLITSCCLGKEPSFLSEATLLRKGMQTRHKRATEAKPNLTVWLSQSQRFLRGDS